MLNVIIHNSKFEKTLKQDGWIGIVAVENLLSLEKASQFRSSSVICKTTPNAAPQEPNNQT